MFLRTLTALLLCLALVGPAMGQPAAESIGVAFDAAGSFAALDIPGFVVSNMFVVAFGLEDVSGWESSVTDITAAGWNILGHTLNPATALNVGSVNNFIVGLGECVQSGSGAYALVNYQIGYFVSPVAPNDVLICVGGSSPSSFGGQPGYSSCADALIPLSPSGGNQRSWWDIPNGCGVINCTTCFIAATEETSFGAVKARY